MMDNFGIQIALKHMKILTKKWAELEYPCFLEFRAIPHNGGPKIKRCIPTDEAQLLNCLEWAAAQNMSGDNIYYCVNPVLQSSVTTAGATDKDIAAAFYCFVDADDEGRAERVLCEAPIPPDLEVITGNTPFKRAHYYWELEEPITNLDEWRTFQKQFANVHNTDSVVVNPSRLMRLAGFWTNPHEKKKEKGYIPELVTLVQIGEEISNDL
jgi:hypothetical protein